MTVNMGQHGTQSERENITILTFDNQFCLLRSQEILFHFRGKFITALFFFPGRFL
jgi:hypothetical protein